MKTDFDKEFEALMTEKKEIPVEVRDRLDSTYDMLLASAARRKRKSGWKRVSAAACALLISGALLANEEVRANIGEFFLGQDKGIEKALGEGFGEVANQTVTDENVAITLQQNFSDANKIGLGFQLSFTDSSLLTKDLTEVSMDYRLKNGDGEYIAEFIPDTKQLKGNTFFASGHRGESLLLDLEKGILQYDIIIGASNGNLPQLKDAVIEIESINLFNESGQLQKIEGTWHLPVVNNHGNISTFEYVAIDSNENIEVVSSIASPTSLNMELIIESGTLHSDGLGMKVVDELGVEYESEGYGVETVGDQFIVHVNFPISAYHDAKNLRLIVDDVGEVELKKK